MQAGTKKGSDIPEEDRDYYLERRYPAFGNLVPRDVASRAAKERCDHGFGVNNTGLAVFLDFSESINRLGIDTILQRYGNLFDMYEEITDVNPGELANEINGVKYYNPMMIFPAIHYTMGGIWVDYELMTTVPGLFAIGECNFSDHGANRLGASALMQGLADGYFVLPYTIQNYLADQALWAKVPTDRPEFEEAEKAVMAETDRLMGIQGKRSVDSAADAARALEPLAGQYASTLFALGMVGASFLAACVLPGITASAICEAFGWERGADRSWQEAPVFSSFGNLSRNGIAGRWKAWHFRVGSSE